MKSLAWVFLVVVLVLVPTWGCGSSSSTTNDPVQQFIEATLGFCQFSYQNFGPYPPLPNSPFGGVTVAFDAPEGVYFFSCLIQTATTTQWQIQNAPLLSRGVPTQVYLPIDWTANQAMDPIVTSVNYAHSLSTLPIQQAPESFLTADVAPYLINYDVGIQMAMIDPLPPVVVQPFQFPQPALPAIQVEFGRHKVFTNQDCQVNECCPAAVSNSLKTIGVSTAAGPGGMPPGGPLEIGDMKGPTGWGPGGTGIMWWTTKGPALMASHGVTTTSHPVPATAADRITLICDMMKAIQDGKDVEMQNGHHIAMVTAIYKVTIDGKTTYSIDVAHDTNQGNPGGTINETLIYNPTTGTLSGGVPGFFPGTSPTYFTVESK